MDCKLKSSIWYDAGFLALSPAEKLAAIWAISTNQVDTAGVLRFSPMHFQLETGLDTDIWESMVEAFQGFIVPLNNRRNLYWIKNYMRFQIGSGRAFIANSISKTCISSIGKLPAAAAEIIIQGFPEVLELARILSTKDSGPKELAERLLVSAGGSEGGRTPVAPPSDPPATHPRGGKEKEKENKFSSSFSTHTQAGGGSGAVAATDALFSGQLDSGSPKKCAGRPSKPGAGPDVEEVVREGMVDPPVPEEYCRHYWHRKTSQGLWRRKRVNWRMELREWWANDRLGKRWAMVDHGGDGKGGKIAEIRAKIARCTDPQRIAELEERLSLELGKDGGWR